MVVELDRVIVQLNNVIVRTVALDRPVLTIGRSADTALQLPHPRVSRLHAEIRRGAGATAIIDLGSANGIVVDGKRLPAHQPLPLVPGTVVQIGPYTLSFHTPDGPAPPAADLSDKTIMDVRADLQIRIDPRRRQDEVDAIIGSDFFKRLRDDNRRRRPKTPTPPDGESP
jgi:pSer/pThr/pTyr-binding forkhead associated (FHA) protein